MLIHSVFADKSYSLGLCMHKPSILERPTTFLLLILKDDPEGNTLRFGQFKIWINWKLSDERILHFKQIAQLHKI